MSVESDVFYTTDFVGAGQTVTFSLFGGGVVDGSFWDIYVMPTGTNQDIEIIREHITKDASGKPTQWFTVRNNSGNDTFFTRIAVRTPNF